MNMCGFQKKIKIFEPHVDTEDEKAVLKVLKSKIWSRGDGTGLVKEFEEKFKKFIGCKDCVAVNSGTAALHLALSLKDLKNKEVIIPSLSSVGLAHAIKYNGGIPIFADVNLETLSLSTEYIKAKISKKSSVVIPVHFGGVVSELKEIQDFCKEENLDLIEDAALAAGSKYNGKRIGTHSNYVCFSFHPVKNLVMPKGGLIAINGNKIKKEKEELIAKRWYGVKKNGIKEEVKYIGWNYYMDEFSAAIGIKQLQKFPKIIKVKQEIAKRYFEEIKLQTKMPINQDWVPNFYWIMTKNRKTILREFKQNKIEVGIYHTPIHKSQFYKKRVNLKNTEKISHEIVCLPLHTQLTDLDITRILKITNRYG